METEPEHNSLPRVVQTAVPPLIGCWRAGLMVTCWSWSNKVALRGARLVPGWITVLGRVNHLGLLSLTIPLCVGAMSTSEIWGVNRHTTWCISRYPRPRCQLVSGWGLVNRNQRQSTGTGSASEAWSRRCGALYRFNSTLLYLRVRAASTTWVAARRKRRRSAGLFSAALDALDQSTAATLTSSFRHWQAVVASHLGSDFDAVPAALPAFRLHRTAATFLIASPGIPPTLYSAAEITKQILLSPVSR